MVPSLRPREGDEALTWIRLDDDFPEHPKVAAVGPLGIAMQVSALAYAARNLTDGFIPDAVAIRLIDVSRLAQRAEGRLLEACEAVRLEDLCEQLVVAGLWERVEEGFQIHDYLDYNPRREEVLAQNPRWTPRQAMNGGRTRTRAARRDEQGQLLPGRDEWPMDRIDRSDAKGASGRFVSAGRTTNAQVNTSDTEQTPRSEPASLAPVPEPLEPTSPETVTLDIGGVRGGDFDRFWEVYPRKAGKRAARFAFLRAARRALPDVCIDGAKRYAADPNRDPAFTCLPATWLNQDRWEDDPLPQRSRVRDRAAEILAEAVEEGFAWNAMERGEADGPLAGQGPGGPGAGVLPPP